MKIIIFAVICLVAAATLVEAQKVCNRRGGDCKRIMKNKESCPDGKAKKLDCPSGKTCCFANGNKRSRPRPSSNTPKRANRQKAQKGANAGKGGKKGGKQRRKTKSGKKSLQKSSKPKDRKRPPGVTKKNKGNGGGSTPKNGRGSAVRKGTKGSKKGKKGNGRRPKVTKKTERSRPRANASRPKKIKKKPKDRSKQSRKTPAKNARKKASPKGSSSAKGIKVSKQGKTSAAAAGVRQNRGCGRPKAPCKQLRGRCTRSSQCPLNRKFFDTNTRFCRRTGCGCCYRKKSACSNKPKCNRLGGTCQFKWEPCDGQKKKRSCKGSRKACVCCAPKACKDFGKRCQDAGGSCIFKDQTCNGQFLANFCGKFCGCCFGNGGNPTTTAAPNGNWSRSCRKEFFEHYFAKECKPMGEDGPCPSYFSCPETNRDPNKCYYKGKEYDLQESVPVKDPCSPGCFCGEPFESGDRTEIICAVFSCQFLDPPIGPDCLPLYSHEQCCPFNTTCSFPQNVTCEVNNQTYVKGQYISYKESPCQSCICEEGHDGPQGPGCQPVDCGLDFRNTEELDQGCVPLYSEKGCCPIDWICPDERPPTGRQDDKCYFGDQIFSLGERLERENCNEVCGCHTPPELTCIKYKDCEEAQNNIFFPRI